MPPGEDGYLLDNGHAEAGARFEALAALFDPSTFRHIEALGLQPGWRCWEAGAGGPNVANWLVQRVGPGGHVVATDIDVSHLRGGGARRLSGRAPRPRYRTSAAGTVRPGPCPPGAGPCPRAGRRPGADDQGAATGGWLLVEEADPDLQPLVCPDDDGPEQQRANRLKHGFRALMDQRGADLAYGRTLPRRLRAAGLLDVGADAFFPMTGPVCAALEQATVAQIRERLVAGGAPATRRSTGTWRRSPRAGSISPPRR